MTIRLTLATALTVPLLLLSACGDTTSIADPPVGPPTASPSSTAPPKPETPQHFIRRFISVSNAMETSGGTAAYLALTSHCRTCRLLARQISSARTHGGFYKSRGWTLKRVDIDFTGKSGGINVHVLSAPTTFRMSTTGPVRHYAGGALSFRLDVRRTGEHWRVTNVIQVAQ